MNWQKKNVSSKFVIVNDSLSDPLKGRILLMPFKSLNRLPLLLLLTVTIFGTICIGCQLLRPYNGPVTPTPDHWKGSYDAPDAGQPAIPLNWKDEPIQTSSLLLENNNLENNASDAYSNTNTEICLSPICEEQSEPEIEEPRFEDVSRNLCNWWEVFQDPILNQLEEQALNSSYTLWAALERVIEARAITRINFAPLLPSINFAPSFSRTGSLYQFPPLPFANGARTSSSSSSATPPINPAIFDAVTSIFNDLPADFRFVQSQYLVPLNLTYEIDLWSQLNNTYYAALIRAQAASQAYLSVLLSLTADVASTYFQLRSLDAQQEVLQRNIRVRQNAYDINSARFNAGLIDYLDVSRAEVELARSLSDSDDVRRMRGLQENILATLLGTPASIFSIEYNPVLIPPPVIPRGLPSELLCRRPDIAEAERNLAAAYRDIGVAYANFFPSLNLNASLGVESPFAHQLFSWHARYWQIGANILQTVFDAGRNQANLDYRKSLFRETMANYQQRVLQSFQDVEDSLVNLREYSRQAQDLALAVRAAQLTLELAQMRYNKGLINYLDVIDAERQLLQTEQSSVIVLGNRYVSTVTLIRALGGGWGPCDSCSEEDEG
jgi:outer membrane protein, multidrug efflux system